MSAVTVQVIGGSKSDAVKVLAAAAKAGGKVLVSIAGACLATGVDGCGGRQLSAALVRSGEQ
jgi:NaMN:DMB phosphoribosyltransferase